MSKSIAIIGGGPAGSTLASFLAKKGYKVGVFQSKKHPELFVGESLVPAIMPIIQELGIEEEVKQFSRLKPGATVWVSPDIAASIEFSQSEGQVPDYAYNTLRKDFDKLLFDTAKKNGATIFNFNAGLQVQGDRILLNEETLTETGDFFDGQPNLIIDASGRRKVITNLLKLNTVQGNRKDVALFSHMKNIDLKQEPSNIHTHRCEKGWCWRIPLQDRTSIGIVVDQNHLKKYGKSTEEQFDNYIQNDPFLAPFFKSGERIAGVQKFSNYQLRTDKLFGPNWAIIGDAAGFVDPVFSSGLYLAMKYGRKVAEAVQGETYSFEDYQNEFTKELESWKKIINTWYNGRFFTTYLIGQDRSATAFGKRIEPHIVKNFSRIFTGEAVTGRYSMSLYLFMSGPLQDFMKLFRMHKYNKQDYAL